MSSIYSAAKLSHVIPVVIGGSLLPYILFPLEDSDQLTIGAVFLQFLSMVVIYCFLHTIWLSGRPTAEVFGSSLERRRAGNLLLLGIPLVAMSVFCGYVLFYPLSLVAPDFVKGWLLDGPELLVPSDRSNALAINLGMGLLLVILTPIVEEVVFRGFLLGRMTAKWGAAVGLWLSSLLFAVLHPDTLGALVFALIVGLTRIKYNSLMAPILMHAGNNLVVFLWGAVELVVFGIEYEYTLAEFRSYVWVAPIAGILGLPWLYRFCRREFLQSRLIFSAG
ncbi:CPBP family intramembrane glutamic endopeptidase [Microbulbifer sp.]|uniref:CPBP family intramembrane glutamic endopeptidase n=1 Tax=Microbulbifer sp. TaxID=1908541 RepID=UPI00258E3001|nr:CPBP family intramembrane glutamic endopeptidase [Microbulbifer sp.]